MAAWAACFEFLHPYFIYNVGLSSTRLRVTRLGSIQVSCREEHIWVVQGRGLLSCPTVPDVTTEDGVHEIGREERTYYVVQVELHSWVENQISRSSTPGGGELLESLNYLRCRQRGRDASKAAGSGSLVSIHR